MRQPAGPIRCALRPTARWAKRSGCTGRPDTARWPRSTTSPTRTTGSIRPSAATARRAREVRYPPGPSNGGDADEAVAGDQRGQFGLAVTKRAGGPARQHHVPGFRGGVPDADLDVRAERAAELQ